MPPTPPKPPTVDEKRGQERSFNYIQSISELPVPKIFYATINDVNFTNDVPKNRGISRLDQTNGYNSKLPQMVGFYHDFPPPTGHPVNNFFMGAELQEYMSIPGDLDLVPFYFPLAADPLNFARIPNAFIDQYNRLHVLSPAQYTNYLDYRNQYLTDTGYYAPHIGPAPDPPWPPR